MWILPTYARPEKCIGALNRIREMGCTTFGLVLVNGAPDGYSKMALPDGWSVEYLPENIGYCAALNYAFNKFPGEPWYGLIGDDELVHTRDWDTKLIGAAGKWFIGHSNDGWQSERRIHGYAAFGGDLVRAIGYLAPPGMWHWYIDNVWEDLSQKLCIKRLCRDVITEHLHYISGKVEKDQTYEAGESRGEQDAEVYKAWREKEFNNVIERIVKKMTQDNQPQHKQAVVSINVCTNRPTPPMFTTALCYLINFLTAHRVQFKLNIMMQASNLSGARQRAINEALEDGSTHILFIDDDMVFPTNSYHLMMEALNSLTMQNIRGAIGVNAVRKSMTSLCYTAKDLDGEWLKSRKQTGLAEVSRMGMGLFMIETDTLRDIPWPHFECKASPDVKEIRGEDYYFCNKLREHGVRLYIEQDLSQDIGHIGDFIFSYGIYPEDPVGEKT